MALTSTLTQRLACVNGWDVDDLEIFERDGQWVMETYTEEGKLATTTHGDLEAMVNLAIKHIGVEEFTKQLEFELSDD